MLDVDAPERIAYNSVDNDDTRTAHRFAKHLASHPRRHNGSINLAFGFNKTIKFSDFAPYGHYMRMLAKVYTKVTGMQGRVLAGRWALHYASMSPAVGPAGFKPMIMRNGARGLNKSGECMAFQYIFNSSWCPALPPTAAHTHTVALLLVQQAARRRPRRRKSPRRPSHYRHWRPRRPTRRLRCRRPNSWFGYDIFSLTLYTLYRHASSDLTLVTTVTDPRSKG